MPPFCPAHQGREHPRLKRHKNSCVHCSVSELGHSVGCRLQSRQGILRKQLLAISNQHTLCLLPDLQPKIFSPSIALCIYGFNLSKSIWLLLLLLFFLNVPFGHVHNLTLAYYFWTQKNGKVENTIFVLSFRKSGKNALCSLETHQSRDLRSDHGLRVVSS